MSTLLVLTTIFTVTVMMINSNFVSGSELESGFYLRVHVGTPGREYRLLLDTGSSDLWIRHPSAKIQTPIDYVLSELSNADDDDETGEKQRSHQLRELGSQTMRPLNRTWHVNYERGRYAGFVGQDRVVASCFMADNNIVTTNGGNNSSSSSSSSDSDSDSNGTNADNNTQDDRVVQLVVDHQAFGVATRLEVGSPDFDGVFGVAYFNASEGVASSSQTSTIDVRSFWTRLRESVVLQHMVLALHLGSTSGTGRLQLELWRRTNHHEQPDGFDLSVVAPPAFSEYAGWWVQVHSFYIGDTPVPAVVGPTGSDEQLSTNPHKALVDTGTSFLMLPRNVFHVVVDRILAIRADCRFYHSVSLIGCNQIGNSSSSKIFEEEEPQKTQETPETNNNNNINQTADGTGRNVVGGDGSNGDDISRDAGLFGFLPVLVIGFRDHHGIHHKVQIHPSHYAIKQPIGDSAFMLAISCTNNPQSTWILGLTFMRALRAVVFRLGHSTIRLVPAKQEYQGNQSSPSHMAPPMSSRLASPLSSDEEATSLASRRTMLLLFAMMGAAIFCLMAIFFVQFYFRPFSVSSSSSRIWGSRGEQASPTEMMMTQMRHSTLSFKSAGTANYGSFVHGEQA